jgi:hypothetical protein
MKESMRETIAAISESVTTWSGVEFRILSMPVEQEVWCGQIK